LLTFVFVFRDNTEGFRCRKFCTAALLLSFLIANHELRRHERWIVDFVDPNLIFYSLCLIAGLFLILFHSSTSRVSLIAKYLIFPVILIIPILVNVAVFKELNKKSHSNGYLINIAAQSAGGCVVGLGFSVYLAGGGVPFFMPHIHGSSLVAEHLQSDWVRLNCSKLYLLWDVKKETVPVRFQLYGRTWTPLARVETEDIQNSYVLTFFEAAQ